MRYLAMFYQVTGSVTGWHGYCRVSVSVAKDGPSEADTNLLFKEFRRGFVR